MGVAMDARVPHAVRYETVGKVPVSLIAQSLVANEEFMKEAIVLLELLTRGVVIDKVEISLSHVTQESPLDELFWIAMVTTYQEDLVIEVPAMVEAIWGAKPPGEYHTIITLLVVLVAYYGAKAAYGLVSSGLESMKINRAYDGVVMEMAKAVNKSEDEIKKELEARYGQPGLKRLASAAVRFFSPAKHEGAVAVRAGDIVVPPEVVADVPSIEDYDDLKPEEISEPHENVEIELHAQDVDRRKMGWAGVVKDVHPDRLKILVYPTIKPEEIYTKTRVRGDILLMSKWQPGGTYKPHAVHLLNVKSAE